MSGNILSAFEQPNKSSTVLHNHKGCLTGTKDKGLVTANNNNNRYLGTNYISKVKYNIANVIVNGSSMDTELKLLDSLMLDHYSKHSGHANGGLSPISA